MKHPTRVVLIILAVWLAAQSIGLLTVEHYLLAELPTGIERPELEATSVPWYLLVGIAIGTGLVLLLARFKQKSLWAVWFSLAVFTLSYVALSAFLAFPLNLLVSALFVWFKLDTRLHWTVRNLPELFLYAGIAAIFVPLLTVPIALIILAGISIYDAIAVWQSKHMVSLAKFQIESGRFAGFSMPRERAPSKKSSSSSKKPVRSAKKRDHAHNHESAILGGGDFAFPLFYTGAILLSFGWVPAIASTVGGYLGLLLLFVFSKEGRFYPAMPFLSAGLVLGSLVALL